MEKIQQPASVPAVYDKNREANGHFAKGNRASVGNRGDLTRKFKELRALWWDANTLEDMRSIKAALFDLCLHAKTEDVKLRAIIYALDRTYGRPAQPVEMELTDNAARPVLPDLSPAEVTVLEKLVMRTASAEVRAIDAETGGDGTE